MALALERGLRDARGLIPGDDGNAGRVDLFLRGRLQHDGTGEAMGTLEYLHHLAGGTGWDVSAFARGSAGAANRGDGWRGEVSGMLGIGGRW